MLICVEDAACCSSVDFINPAIVLVVEGLDAVGAVGDIMALAELQVHVAAYCWSVAVVAREGIRA
jgi:hypothetical protein